MKWVFGLTMPKASEGSESVFSSSVHSPVEMEDSIHSGIKSCVEADSQIGKTTDDIAWHNRWTFLAVQKLGLSAKRQLGREYLSGKGLGRFTVLHDLQG